MSFPTRPLARPWVRATAPRPRPDLLAMLALLGFIVAGSWDLLRWGGTTVGLDAVAFFYPMFSFLGERLRAGELPGWNPYQFAGAPFAADPESGWMYLPAMLLFALLPLAAAAKAFAFVHLALAGFGTYAVARVLGMGPVGALTAGVAFVGSGFFADRSRCCFAHVQVAAWVPLLLIGTELAIRGRGWTSRAGWWGLAGFSLSQILAAWLGQGAYYALLALGAFVLYRTLIDPPAGALPSTRTITTARARLAALLLHGAAVLLIGFGLAAAGILPRLEYHARSNLADGYGGNPNLAWAADLGAWPWRHAIDLLFGRTGWYVGGAVAALAVVAPFLARRRHATPFFLGLTLAGLALATEAGEPFRAVLYALLPRFEEFHRHRPDRVLGVAFFSLALLAGAAVGALPHWRGRPGRLALVAAWPGLLLLSFLVLDFPVAGPARTTLLAAGLGLAAYALLPRSVGSVVSPLLVLLVFGDLVLASRENVARGLFTAVDLATYDDPTGAAAFFRSPAADPGGRYFGYDPALRSDYFGQTMLYRHEYRDPGALALLVNNRATLLRLPDLQGYNPIQLQRSVAFMAALNGHPQEYHGSYVFADGLDSPLLDLLNARYVVLPADIAPDRADLSGLSMTLPTVYLDDEVRVVENPEALPRAWLVHDARRVAPGEALPFLASGAVDPRRTALLETDPPDLAPPADPAADAATIEVYEPDRLLVRTRSDAPALLMLSEVYDPAWHASVDGKPAPVSVADHALRAVPVPAGEHEIELRYESRALRLGLTISLAGYAGLGCLALAAGWRRCRPWGWRQRAHARG